MKTVQFADGEAKIYIDLGFGLHFYILIYSVCAGISVLIWVLIFSIGMRRELKSIRKLDQIIRAFSVGAMDAEISVKGSTEVMNLADGLDRMRNEIVSRRETEKTMRKAQEKLVLGMAHDLRNPLTGLMSYIEIVKGEVTSEDGKKYSDRAMRKAREINDLSDQLFDFFLVQTKEEVELERPEALTIVLEDFLSDMVMVLEMNGFETDAEGLSWPEIELQVNYHYMGRIFQNLISNLLKYADKQYPVSLVSECTEKRYILYIRNVPHNLPEKPVKGTKIGVDNIIGMMRQMHCRCEVTQRPDFYETKFIFPIVREEPYWF